MNGELVGGLDVGTTRCKITLYTVDGKYVDSSYKEYNINRSNGLHEIDASTIKDSVFSVISECARRHKNIQGIGVTSFGESFVMLDENDTPIFPIMLYTDPRGERECEEILSLFDGKALTKTVGVAPHSMYSLPKIMWIKNNHPEVYERAKCILLISDYISYLLTGVRRIDYSLASRTMAFDIENKCFYTELLEKLGIDAGLFSTPVATGSIVGKVKMDVAQAIGLSESTVVVTGCHDQIASAIGAGALDAGEAVDGSGTVECVTPIFDAPPMDESFYGMGYPTVPFGAEGKYTTYALSFAGGAALKWYKDNFAKHLDKNAYAMLDSSISDEPTGILVMPHFAGAGNPYMDNASRAAFIGLTLEHTAGDVYKAIMEGVAYEMRQSLEAIRPLGVAPIMLYATGGGARSKKWLQIKADITGLPIVPIEAKEIGAQGMCMMVAVSLGYYKTLAEAKGAFVKSDDTVYPIEANKIKYDGYYKAYKKIYGLVRPLIKETEKQNADNT